ncbi:hypothetical protein H4R34_003145 [Dimargaris verticillata]|uniref:RING-type domain-containing protein n=1 Tax=Dimargaris verticillata TaxID=2761393 RepID=A0A9W8ECX1_9FUNG|nr:hypothetical protein H4R34_003145 [Dimargaris verticillata]
MGGILYDVDTVLTTSLPSTGNGMLYYATDGAKTANNLQGYMKTVFVYSNDDQLFATKVGPIHRVDTVVLPRNLGADLLNLLNAANANFAVAPNGINATIISAIHGAIKTADPSGELVPRLAFSAHEQHGTDSEDSQSPLSAGTIVGIVATIIALLCIVSAMGFCICRTHRFAQARERRQRRRLERQRQEQLALEGGVPVAPEIRDVRRDRALQTFFTAMTKPETPPIQRTQLDKIKTFLITKKRMAAIQDFWRENQCNQTCALHSQMGSLSTLVTSTGTVALNGVSLPPVSSQTFVTHTIAAPARSKQSGLFQGLRGSFAGLKDEAARRFSAPTREKCPTDSNRPSPLHPAMVSKRVLDLFMLDVDEKADELGRSEKAALAHASIPISSLADLPCKKKITVADADCAPKLNSALNLWPAESTQADGHDAGITTMGTSVSDIASCSICLCNFQLGDEARKLPCRHVFHKECIDVWLLNHSALCPICREHCLDKS